VEESENWAVFPARTLALEALEAKVNVGLGITTDTAKVAVFPPPLAVTVSG
jgi:hypothetical protein